jgi:hypothetical protein
MLLTYASIVNVGIALVALRTNAAIPQIIGRVNAFTIPVDAGI